ISSTSNPWQTSSATVWAATCGCPAAGSTWESNEPEVMMRTQIHLPVGRRSQRGATLIEALVALMVMSFGMVALVGLMGNLRRSSDVAKQRREAMRLGQAEWGALRSFSVLKKPDRNSTRLNSSHLG